MLRPIWWQPFYSPALESVVSYVYRESWAWPVTTTLDASNITLARDPLDMAEFGHKEQTL